jgi:NADPH:quinone reductase-like Zn-dependent oxidoreductase
MSHPHFDEGQKELYGAIRARKPEDNANTANMPNMKEAIIAKGLKTTIQDVPIPEPQPDQVIIQVVVSGSNPKDWKIPELVPDYNANSGDDIAGIVHSVGSNVWEFKKGDRVASFHEMMAPGGSFAEYAVGWQHTTFHLPNNLSFEGRQNNGM